MAKQGRPSKLTAAIADQFCGHIANGMSRHRAADLIGVNRRTVQRWIAVSRSGTGKGVYGTFAVKIALAEAQFIEENVKAVKKAATPRTSKVVKRTVRNTYDLAGQQTGTSEVIEETTKRELDWGAARWLLECKDRESFGSDRHEIAALKADINELRKLLTEAIGKAGRSADDQAGGAVNPLDRAGAVAGGLGNPAAALPAGEPASRAVDSVDPREGS